MSNSEFKEEEEDAKKKTSLLGGYLVFIDYKIITQLMHENTWLYGDESMKPYDKPYEPDT